MKQTTPFGKLLLSFVWMLLGFTAWSQTPTYEMYVTNQSQIDSKTYQFDVYLLRTGSTSLELASIQFGLGVDTMIVNGGTLSFSLVSGSSQLVSSQVPVAFSVGAVSQVNTVNGVVYRYLNQAARSGPGAGSGTVISNVKTGCSSPGTRIGTYRLTNTVDFRQASSCKHIFNTGVAAGRTNTLVNAYIGTTNTAITATSGHLAYNSTGTCDQNLSLNGCAVVASITDNSGVTCFGGSNGSVTVSLSGTGTSSSGTYSVDGGTAVSYSSNPFTVSGLGAGSHNISITSGLCSASTGSFTISGPSSALSSSFSASGCDSYTLPWSTVVTTSGEYTHTYTSVDGCDSTVTATITITASTSNTTTESACDSYTWSVNGQTYTSSGSYSSTTGCYTEILNLTITASTSNTTTFSACDSYVWSVNGQTYTESGSYTSVSGCATEILSLTVNSSSNSSSSVTECNSYTLPWGTVVTTSGQYSNVYQSSTGCDSTVTVDVTINNSTNTTESATICASAAPYSWNGTDYSTSGTYTYGFTNSDGCASVATLVLTVNEASSSTLNQTICANQLPYTWNGVIFTAAGTQTATLTNAAGCDSVITMNLAVSGGIPVAPTAVTQALVVNNCGARVYRYTAAVTANASGYSWTLPTGVGGVTGVTVDSGDITSSRVIRLMYASNAAALSTDSIKVRAYSGCGNSANKGFKLTNTAWAPLAAPTITATNVVTNICGERKVRYSVANPAATAGAVGFEWSFAGSVLGANATIDSGDANSRVIVVLYTSNEGAAADDSVRVRYNYNSGCTFGTLVRAKIGLVKLNAPAAPAITTQNVVTNICGARKVRYSVPTTPGASATAGAATGYVWSFVGAGLGANATIDSGDANSRVIVVLYTSNDAALSTDSVRCLYTSVCGDGANGKSKIGLAKLGAPLAPATLTITAVAPSVCGAKLYRYTAPAVLPSATTTAGAATGYEWSFTGSLGSNATIDSGDATSRIILVRFTSNAAAGVGDSVRVRYNSGCGYGPNKAAKLTNVATGVPAAPSAITITPIQTNVCGARVYRYAAPALPAATATLAGAIGYEWSFVGLGLNATIDSGDINSRIIRVSYTSNVAAGAGDSVRVRYASSCGYSNNKASKLSNTALNPPAAPSAITITPVSATTCGARVYRYAAPTLPLATTTTGAATGYVWSFTGTLGANATIDSGDAGSRVILVRYTSNVAAGAGDSVRVRYTSGCGLSANKASKLSNLALANCPPPTAKVSAPASFGVNVYPNPSNGQFNVQLSGATSEVVNVRILDAQGRYIKAVRSAGNGVITLGSDLKAGSYLVEVRQGNNVKVTRVLKF